MSLKSDGSPGQDEIPPRVLKELKHLISEPLAHIINLSIGSGIVPDLDYRPISLLSVIAKVLEKVVNYRLMKYLETNNIISSRQFGFRSKRSTEDAVTLLTDNVAQALDTGEKCIGVFLDLKKAFDTVSILILLKKLECLGISGLPLQWFTSFYFSRAPSIYTNTNKQLQLVNYTTSKCKKVLTNWLTYL